MAAAATNGSQAAGGVGAEPPHAKRCLQRADSAGPAAARSAYSAKATRTGTYTWTASIGGTGLGYQVALSGLTRTDFTGESWQPAGRCNKMDVNFSNSTWYTSNMGTILDTYYHLGSVGTSSWRSYGG